METINPPKPIQNLLVLVAVCGLVLAGWLAGHIVRHITPAYQHPPSQEIDPHIKTGYFLGPDDQFTIITSLDGSLEHVYINGMQVNGLGVCAGNTFFTSFPAKCQSMDGKLVSIGGVGSNIIVIPQGK